MRALIADIIAHAAHLSGFTVDEIKGHCRSRSLVRVRQAVYLIAREQKRHDGDLVLVAYSFPQLGAALKRDHSTVIHGVQKALDTVKREPDFAAFVADLREAAETGQVFARLALPVAPPPVVIPAFVPQPKARIPAKVAHIKAITLREGEEADAGHKFHDGIAKGSAALLKALAA